MITKFRKIEKRSPTLIFLLTLLIVFILAVIGFLFVANLNLCQKDKELNRKTASLERETGNLEKENRELKAQTFRASQDEYTEKMLREKGMYKRPGEGVVVVAKEKGNQGEQKETSFFKKSSTAVSVGFSAFIIKISEFFKKLNLLRD